MYKKATVFVGSGKLCQATATENGTLVTVHDGNRVVRRQMQHSGKVFGARAVSYADAYYEFPTGTMEVWGEEIVYADR